jgi:murein DD-endopeptidase MepM/ murein hydrolase activator NlpD
MKDSNKIVYSIISLSLIFLLGWVGLGSAKGATVQEIQDKINGRNTQIAEIEKEIAEYQKELEVTGKEAQTLQSTLKTLDTTAKKLAADIRLTQSKISLVTDNIADLSGKITDKGEKIEQNVSVVAKSLRSIQSTDDISLVEMFLSQNNISDFWNDIETLQTFQAQIQEQTKELQTLKVGLETERAEEEKARKELLSLRSQLSDQRNIVEQNKQEKSKLLSQTKNKETTYKKLLDEKKIQKEAFEKELMQFEADLRVAIDPNSIPGAAALFTWPFDSSRINPLKNITQLFGGTEFAKLNPQVYGRPFHNGTDFGIPFGTPVKSALRGTVVETGNTDIYEGCYSYGKWVLVRHTNGLSTLYAHLSRIQVASGQEVSTGELIGYSGNTGYSTGPHLHFTVYVTQGVQVMRLGDAKLITKCANARIPVAPFEGYLDPMTYLPHS